MRSSNPVFSSLTREARGRQQAYSQASYGQAEAFNQYGAGYGQPTGVATTRPMTHDDVITKTGITVGVIFAVALPVFFIANIAPGIGSMLTFAGMIGGLITVLIASFKKIYGSAALTLTYAAFEGLFVGGLSAVFGGMATQTGALIGQAILGTLGVFLGMLWVYKAGIVKVTPRLTRMVNGALIGILVMALGNMLLYFFTGNNPLTNGGPLAIVFSLFCIGIAAVSFLNDFDAADQLVRGGAPSNMAWGVALGLAATLVWLYTEILRFLSYFNRN